MNFFRESVGVMGVKSLLILGCAFSRLAFAAQDIALELSMIRFEQLTGGVEQSNGEPRSRMLREMPAGSYEYKDGVYKSLVSRISLKLPQISMEKAVGIRESITMVRADRSPATTHLIIDAGGLKITSRPDDAVSVVVVTRLRDDRPKDAESILSRLDGGAQQRETLTRQGFEYVADNTPLGPGLRRIVPNRAYNDRFPYQLAVLKGNQVTTYGVTQYVVVGTDSFLEFSQVFPCAQRSASECRAAAVQAMTDFVGGVTEFKMYPPLVSPVVTSDSSSSGQ